MIHYQLRCTDGHGFDGWFRDSGTFERQSEAGLIGCPECGSVSVHRALMAPALARGGRVVDQAGVEQREEAAPAAVAAVAPKAAVLPDQVRAVLQRMRAEVEKHCEHVGDRFAEEARAIHRGDTEARGIYGEATPEQAEALADEGIEVVGIPWVPRADS